MNYRISKIWLVLVLLFAVVLGYSSQVKAYSVLSHESFVDESWNKDIQPLLQKRFPCSTQDELRVAHGYAYGGAIIQDMGYYPYGSKFFSDLMHYVRSGDFIMALIRDSESLNDYAFALGALSHYTSDLIGHPESTNLVVPLLYPKLKKKFGDVITYEDDPLSHLQTEFGFDVLEVAKHRFAPTAYHDFIGFEVDRPLLDKAFQETYGLEISSLLKDEPKTISSYRHAVSSTIPKATKVAWSLKKKDIQKDLPGMTRKQFLFNLSEGSYQKNWGNDYRKPTFKEKIDGFLTKLIPKIGRFKAIKFRMPTPEAEKLFEKGFNEALAQYHNELTQLKRGHLKLLNDNFDIGIVSKPGQYFLSDNAYAELLDRLAKQDFCSLTPSLRSVILQFYADPDAPYSTKKDPKQWEKLQVELEKLRNLNRIDMLILGTCTMPTRYIPESSNKYSHQKSHSL